MAGAIRPLADILAGLAVRAGHLVGTHPAPDLGLRDRAGGLVLRRLARGQRPRRHVVPRAPLAPVLHGLAGPVDRAPQLVLDRGSLGPGSSLCFDLLAGVLGAEGTDLTPADRPSDGLA